MTLKHSLSGGENCGVGFCHNYSKNKKVKLVSIEFSDYSIVWWDKLVLNKRRNRELTMTTWEEMKR